MNRYLYVVLLTTCGQLLFTQALPLQQSFEGAVSDNWNFTTNPAAFNADGDIWDRVSDGGQYFTPAPDGTNFWEFYDIDVIPDIPADEICYLSFETVDLSGKGSCTLSFSYCNRGLDSTDYMSYTIMYDNSNNWASSSEIILPNHTASVSTWFTVYVNIPESADYCRVKLSAKANYSADCGGFDNIQLKEGESLMPVITIITPVDGFYYANSISNIVVSGTATNISGVIGWSNELNNASGWIDVTNPWTVASVPLNPGKNLLKIEATNTLGIATATSVTALRGYNLSTDKAGMIAFTSFNSVTDSFSFVVLNNIDAGTLIRFTDEEWEGLEFGGGEDDLIWSNTVAIAAGTVISIKDCDNNDEGINVTEGFIAGKLSLAQSGEDIYAYLGDTKRQPTAFLAMISTANGELRGTGLAFGESAVNISKTPTSQYYSGIRGKKQAWSAYLPEINSASNWSGTDGVTESWGCCSAFRCKNAGSVLLVQ